MTTDRGFLMTANSRQEVFWAAESQWPLRVATTASTFQLQVASVDRGPCGRFHTEKPAASFATACSRYPLRVLSPSDPRQVSGVAIPCLSAQAARQTGLNCLCTIM